MSHPPLPQAPSILPHSAPRSSPKVLFLHFQAFPCYCSLSKYPLCILSTCDPDCPCWDSTSKGQGSDVACGSVCKAQDWVLRAQGTCLIYLLFPVPITVPHTLQVFIQGGPYTSLCFTGCYADSPLECLQKNSNNPQLSGSSQAAPTNSPPIFMPSSSRSCPLS